MMKKLLFMIGLYLFFLPIVQAGFISDYTTLVLSEVHFNPDGSDTGKEFVEFINIGVENINIGGWDLDAGALPYFSLPEQTIVESGEIFTLYLRSDGETGSGSVFTGSSFGSSNMGNTSGMVTLFDSTSHSEETIRDYIAYGGGGQTHESKAIAAGLWQDGNFISVENAGGSIHRTCLELIVDCWTQGDSTPDISYLSVMVPEEEQQSEPGTDEEEVPTADTNEVVIEDETIEENSDPNEDQMFVQVEMKEVSFLDVEHDYIVLTMQQSNTGSLLQELTLRVDSKLIDLSQVPISSEPQLVRVQLGESDGTIIVGDEFQMYTSELSGLVSTTEQVWVETPNAIVDGVCWEKLPIPLSEQDQREQFLSSGVWQGDCINSTLFDKGDVLRKVNGEWERIATEIEEEVVTVTGENIQTTSGGSINTSCTAQPEEGSIQLSEIFPNPDGSDTDNEWIELYNPTSSKVVFCDLLLDDIEGGSSPYDLTGSVIAAHGFLIVKNGESKIVLNNGEETVRLLRKSTGNVVDKVTYFDAPEDMSYSRRM